MLVEVGIVFGLEYITLTRILHSLEARDVIHDRLVRKQSDKQGKVKVIMLLVF